MTTSQKRATTTTKEPSLEPTTEPAETVHADATALSPYVQFFDAIERLEDDRVVFGTASLEAGISRARVNRLRELAVAEWRLHHAA